MRVSASRVGVVVAGLAVCSGCAEVRTVDNASVHGMSAPDALAFILLGVTVFLALSGILALLSQRSRRRKLAKILVAVLAGEPEPGDGQRVRPGYTLPGGAKGSSV